jgi:hypothetical protein
MCGGEYKSMARYEEMDKLLKGMRERLGVRPSNPQPEVPAERSPAPPRPKESEYASLAIQLSTLQRESERLRRLLTPDHLESLTPAQRSDLVALLGQVMDELQRCEGSLAGIVYHE